MTHAELVKRAERWLRNTRRCGVVICEASAHSGETPDAIGWRLGGKLSVLVECKVSRADFLADKRKSFRADGWPSAMGNERYYLAPAGLIRLDELPRNWGLLELSGRYIKCRKRAQPFASNPVCKAQEMSMLWGHLRLYQIARTGTPLFPSKRAAQIERDLGKKA